MINEKILTKVLDDLRREILTQENIEGAAYLRARKNLPVFGWLKLAYDCASFESLVYYLHKENKIQRAESLLKNKVKSLLVTLVREMVMLEMANTLTTTESYENGKTMKRDIMEKSDFDVPKSNGFEATEDSDVEINLNNKEFIKKKTEEFEEKFAAIKNQLNNISSIAELKSRSIANA